MGIVAGTVGMGLFSSPGIFCRERVVQNSDEPKVLDCFRFLFQEQAPASHSLLQHSRDGRRSYRHIRAVFLHILPRRGELGHDNRNPRSYFRIFDLSPPARSREKMDVEADSRSQTILKARRYDHLPHRHEILSQPAVIVPLLMIQGFIFSSLTSINMVVPTKMIGDTVDYMEWKTGERNEGHGVRC